MTRQQDVFGILVDAVIVAMAERLTNRQAPSVEQIADWKKAIKATLTEDRINKICQEWEDAVEARIGEGWLRQVIAGQAVEWAEAAIAVIG